MNKIDKLLEELCPEGVEYKPLGEIADYPNKRISIKEIDCYVGVENLLKDKQGVSKSGVKPDSGNAILFIPNDILIGNIRPYLKKIWLADSTGGTNGDVVLVRVNPKYDRKVNRKFLFFILSSDSFFLYDNNHAKGGKMPRGDKNKIKEYEIPLPPIEVQNEIVHILDRFTDLVVELQAKLQAELQARIQQYEYYRNKLLSFNEIGGGTQGVTWMRMSDIGSVCMCKRIMKNQTNTTSGVPFYKIGTFGKVADAYISNELYEYYKNKYSYPKKGDILMSASGTIGKTVIFDGKPSYFQDSNIVWINNDESKALNKYLYYYYQIIDWKTEGGTIKRLYNNNLAKTEIPIPSLSEQERIVEILDRFERLTTDLQSGIPAEIKARQQQYEYYRNRLLTFKRKTA